MDVNEVKKIFSKNLNHYMKINGKSRMDIAEELGISYYTVTDWAKGKKYPRMDKVEKLAHYFCISKSDLIENNSKVTSKGIRIPVLGTVPAGIPISAVEDIIDYEEIDERTAACGEYFALRVKGNSMQPTITDGETVIVKVQNSVDSGDVAVVGINGDEATIKRIKLMDKGIMLIPDNKDFEPYFYTNEEIENIPIRIIGKAIESRKKL